MQKYAKMFVCRENLFLKGSCYLFKTLLVCLKYLVLFNFNNFFLGKLLNLRVENENFEKEEIQGEGYCQIFPSFGYIMTCSDKHFLHTENKWKQGMCGYV